MINSEDGMIVKNSFASGPSTPPTTSDVTALNDTIASLREVVGGLKGEIGGLKDEMKDLKNFLGSKDRLDVLSSNYLDSLLSNSEKEGRVIQFNLADLQNSKDKFKKSSQVFERKENFDSKEVALDSGYFSQTSQEDLTNLAKTVNNNTDTRGRRKSIEKDIRFGVSAQMKDKGSIMEDMHRAIPFRVRRNSIISIKLDEESTDVGNGNENINNNVISRKRKHSLDELKEEDEETEKSHEDKVQKLDKSTDLTPTNYAFFAVYDGHGGTQAADFLRQFLHSNIVNHVDFKENPEKAIKEGFSLTEKQFTECVCEGNRSIHGVGSTAVIALIATSPSGTTLYVAHVGDSEAILCRKGKVMALTEPHQLKNTKERERVEQAGGVIYKDRLGHPIWNPNVMSIAVTRAFGDLYFKLPEYTEGKQSGLIAEPEILKIPITTDDDFLLLASDGFWDVVSKDSAVDFVMSQPKDYDVNQICKGLTDYAMRERTLDDTTVLVVKLRH